MMDFDTCVFCKREFGDENTNELTDKGCTRINENSCRNGDSISVQIGQRVHEKCRKKYTRHDYRFVENKSKDGSKESGETPTLRSDFPTFSYKSDCIFCTKTIPGYMFETARLKYSAIRVKSQAFRSEVRSRCLQRADTWGTDVLSRVEFVPDLVATDCVYHRSCMIRFKTERIENDDGPGMPAKKLKTDDSHIVQREEAFQEVVRFLEESNEEHVTLHAVVEKMNSMCDSPYSFRHMKRKLQEHFGENIIISEYNGMPNTVTLKRKASKIIQDYYSLTKGNDKEKERIQIIDKAAEVIKTEIGSLCQNTDTYPTPSDIADVDKNLDLLPKSLVLLLSKLFVGKDTKLKQASIGSSIVQASRPRALLLPMQFGLAVKLHSDFGSRFLIETLHALGLCSSYAEVLNFMQSASMTQTFDVPDLGPNTRFIQYMADNVDHNSRTLDGLNTFHGMGIIASITPGTKHTTPIPRTKATSSDVAAVGKIAIHTHRNVETWDRQYKAIPVIHADDISYNVDVMWKLSWLLHPKTPAWNGTMQMIQRGEYPGRSSVMFLPMIDLDPSNETCIYSTLCYVASHAKRHGVTPVLTFDQPLWMKAQRIVDTEPPSSNIKMTILRLGGFHMQMSFLGSIGHIMSDTGLKEVFEVIYADQTVPHLLSGKAISRASRAHGIVELALHALIVSEVFDIRLPAVPVTDTTDGNDQGNEEHEGPVVDMEPNAKITEEEEVTVLDRSFLREATVTFNELLAGNKVVDDVIEDNALAQVREAFDSAIDSLKVRGRTSRLWLQYMDMLDILRKFIKAERTSNWFLHLSAVSDMLPFFAASGHNAYAKSAHIYLTNMLELETQDKYVFKHFTEGFHSVRRSDRFWAGLSTDLVIEQTLMRSLKSVGGLTRGRGIDESQRALWILARPACAEINEAMQQLTGKKFISSEQHPECAESRKKRDDSDVAKIVAYLEERNPFNGDADLRSISSGVVAGKNVNPDIAKEVGQSVIDKMMNQTVKDLTLKKKDQVTLMRDTDGVTIDAETVNIDPQLLFQRLLVTAQGSVPGDELVSFFSFELCTYPPALFVNPRVLRDAKKALLANEMNKMTGPEVELTDMVSPKYVLDGGALLARLVWPRGNTYNQLCDMYVDYVLRKYGHCIVVFDGYDAGPTTKDNVHRKRAARHAGTEVKVEGDLLMATKKERFLANSKNKQLFINLLSCKLCSVGIDTFHAESDADVLIVQTAIESVKANDTIVVWEDTDLLVLMCFHAGELTHTLLMKPEPKAHLKENKFWNIGKTRDKLGKDVCKNLLFLHAILGCDTTSQPFGIGKATSLKAFRKNDVFRHCAQLFDLDPHIVTKEELVQSGEKAMLCLYNATAGTNSLNELRQKVFLDKTASRATTVHPQALPPTSDACKYHSLRVYHQIRQWKGFEHELDPYEYGWEMRNGLLEPLMTDKEASQNVLKMIRCGCKTGCKSSLCTCRKLGLPCSAVCKVCRGECVNADTIDDELLTDIQNNNMDI